MTKSGPRSWKTDLPLILGILLLCPCIGFVVVGFAGPYQRFPVRARQSECTTNLKQLMLGERVRQRGYSTQLSQLGVTLERGNRYAYFLGPGPLEDRSGEKASGTQEAQGVSVDTWTHKDFKPITFGMLPADVAGRVGLFGQCPDACAITIVCAGNIDRDRTLDIWSISSFERTGPDGQKYPPWEPMNHLDDSKQ